MKPILSIHGGMPKTGTTSIQYAIAASEDALAAKGWIYPRQFRNREGVAHHLLPADLQSNNSTAAVYEFAEYLQSNRSTNVLISSEAFTNSLGPNKVSVLQEFFREASKTHRVVFVLALRRVDDFFQSMYLHSTKVGEIDVSIESYLDDRIRWAEGFFSAISSLRVSGVAEKITLVKYEPSASFLPWLLAALGIDGDAQAAIQLPKHQNPSLGLKAQIVLLNFERIRRELGLNITQADLLRAFERRELVFKDDVQKYRIIDAWRARAIHENALRFSLKFGVDEYYDAFCDALIDDQVPKALTITSLAQADRELLSQFCNP